MDIDCISGAWCERLRIIIVVTGIKLVSLE
jgi:hypothetical protein